MPKNEPSATLQQSIAQTQHEKQPGAHGCSVDSMNLTHAFWLARTNLAAAMSRAWQAIGLCSHYSQNAKRESEAWFWWEKSCKQGCSRPCSPLHAYPGQCQSPRPHWLACTGGGTERKTSHNAEIDK